MSDDQLTVYCSGEGQLVPFAEVVRDANGNLVHNGHYLNGASTTVAPGPIGTLLEIDMVELARRLVREYGIDPE
jgi:hypothetical protein